MYLDIELLCSIACSRHAQRMDRKNKMNPEQNESGRIFCACVCVLACVRAYIYVCTCATYITRCYIHVAYITCMQHTLHTITQSHTFRDISCLVVNMEHVTEIDETRRLDARQDRVNIAPFLRAHRRRRSRRHRSDADTQTRVCSVDIFILLLLFCIHHSAARGWCHTI